MLFAALIALFKEDLAKRAEYRRALEAIDKLSEGDLARMQARRSDLAYEAFRRVYQPSL